jgi:hypothetical protein
MRVAADPRFARRLHLRRTLGRVALSSGTGVDGDADQRARRARRPLRVAIGQSWTSALRAAYFAMNATWRLSTLRRSRGAAMAPVTIVPAMAVGELE